MSAAFSRRTALQASLITSLGLAAGLAPALAEPAPDSVLIAAAGDFQVLCARESQAWDDLDDNEFGDTPAIAACRALSQACRDAGAALSEMPAITRAGRAAKASAMLTLLGPRLDSQAALSEHHLLVASILRDAVRIGGGAHA